MNRTKINFVMAKKVKMPKMSENRALRLAFIGSPRLILDKRSIYIVVGHTNSDNVSLLAGFVGVKKGVLLEGGSARPRSVADCSRGDFYKRFDLAPPTFM